MKRVLLLLLLTALAVAQQVDFRARALDFARLVQSGQYEQAFQMFDATMARAVTLPKLKASWETMTAQHGAFQGFDPPTVSSVQGYQVVLIPTRFARYRCRMKVVLNAQGQVSGYFWVAYQAAARPAYLDTRVREVKVQVGPFNLPGIVTFPEGPVRAGVVLVHGSGPNDMDETIGPNKPFRDLARGLAGQGVVTLRYDKRTKVAGLLMSLQKVTLEDEVLADALAALAVLRARPELKGKPIVVAGHSLGAILGPEIARRDGHLQGLVLMAGPARPFDQALIDQLEYLGTLGGPESRQAVQKMVASVRNLDKLPDDDKSILGAPAYYWREMAAYEARDVETARSLSCPILVLQGGRDYQGTPEDYRLWMAGLKGRAVTGHLFPRLNHLFAPGQGKATPGEYEEQNYVDPEVIRVLGEWLKGL